MHTWAGAVWRARCGVRRDGDGGWTGTLPNGSPQGRSERSTRTTGRSSQAKRPAGQQTQRTRARHGLKPKTTYTAEDAHAVP